MKFFDWSKSWILRKISEMRLEEFIAYFFFIPCLAITLRANFHFYLEGYGLGRKIIGGLWRIAIVAILIPLIPYLSKHSYKSRFYSVMRNAIPFVTALAIYTNLHDTIHFVNPNDVADWFLHADIWIFGVEPTLWAQKFYKPWLTEMFSLFYALYLPLIILLPVTLYIQKKDLEARETLVTIVLCFYWGYVLYILFPTMPPRLWIADQYTHHLEGGLLLSTQKGMVSITPSSSRAAFPSLHAAITLLSLFFSWRFARKLFWLLLPFAIGLHLATIYLRHHYVVDLFAGWILGILAYRYAPVWEQTWEKLRQKLSSKYYKHSML